MKEPEILNLDTLIPPKRAVTITEKTEEPKSRLLRFLYRFFPALRPKLRVVEIDFSQVNVKTSFEIDRQFAAFAAASVAYADNPDDLNNQAVVEQMYDLLCTASRYSCPWITTEWLQNNLTPEQAVGMLEFILKPLQDRLGKNVAAAQAVTGNH